MAKNLQQQEDTSHQQMTATNGRPNSPTTTLVLPRLWKRSSEDTTVSSQRSRREFLNTNASDNGCRSTTTSRLSWIDSTCRE